LGSFVGVHHGWSISDYDRNPSCKLRDLIYTNQSYNNKHNSSIHIESHTAGGERTGTGNTIAKGRSKCPERPWTSHPFPSLVISGEGRVYLLEQAHSQDMQPAGSLVNLCERCKGFCIADHLVVQSFLAHLMILSAYLTGTSAYMLRRASQCVTFRPLLCQSGRARSSILPCLSAIPQRYPIPGGGPYAIPPKFKTLMHHPRCSYHHSRR